MVCPAAVRVYIWTLRVMASFMWGNNLPVGQLGVGSIFIAKFMNGEVHTCTVDAWGNGSGVHFTHLYETSDKKDFCHEM